MFKERWLGLIALACLSLCVGVGVAHYLKYQSTYDKNVAQVIETSQFQLRFTARNFSRLRTQVSSTSQLSNRNSALDDYITTSSPLDKNRVEEIWLGLANYQSFFKQIRFIDNTGKEKIKVSYSYQNQKAEILSDYKNFSDHERLKQAKEIPVGEIEYLDPVLVRDELGIDSTLVPVQYIITPVDVNGKREGYIVLTIDIWLVKSVLDYSPQPEYIPQLITSGGDYLAHPDVEKLFGFSIKNRKIHNLGLTHNELWQDMLIDGSGVTRAEDGLYVYRLIDLSESKSMYALIFFSNKQLSEHVDQDYTDIFESAALIMFLILVACIPFAQLVFSIQRRKVESGLALAALNGMTAVIVCDSRFRVLKINNELERMTGYVESQIRLRKIRKLFFNDNEISRWITIWDCVKNEGVWEGEIKVRGKDNSEMMTLTRVQALLDKHSKITNYIVSTIDISERKELEERLRYLSERDELSQLWNRRKFEEDLSREAGLFERYPEGQVASLALLDIDYFKRINDQLGHDEGDKVIRKVAALLMENTRKTDSVARIGGEEFAIIMRHTSLEDSFIILDRIRHAIETDTTHPATISIGYTDITSNTSTCYKCADVALYKSKSLGRNKVSLCRSTNNIDK